MTPELSCPPDSMLIDTFVSIFPYGKDGTVSADVAGLLQQIETGYGHENMLEWRSIYMDMQQSILKKVQKTINGPHHTIAADDFDDHEIRQIERQKMLNEIQSRLDTFVLTMKDALRNGYTIDNSDIDRDIQRNMEKQVLQKEIDLTKTVLTALEKNI